MIESHNIPIKDSIGFNLLRGVFSIYIVIAIVVTLIHMTTEYFNAKQVVKDDLVLYQRTFDSALSDALWDLDDERVATLTKGILKLPSVKAIQIFDTSGRVVTSLPSNFKENQDTSLREARVIKHGFNITYQRENEHLQVGSGLLYSDREVVISKVSTGFALIIINSLIKTAALWAIFLWLVKPMIINPLVYMSNSVRDITIERLNDFKLSIRTSHKNEFKILEESFNSMTARLNTSLNEINATSNQLNSANNYLEQLLQSVQFMMQATSKPQLIKSYIHHFFKGLTSLTASNIQVTYVERLPNQDKMYRQVDYDVNPDNRETFFFQALTVADDRLTDKIPALFKVNHTQFYYSQLDEYQFLHIPFWWQGELHCVMSFRLSEQAKFASSDESFLVTLCQLFILVYEQIEIKQNLEQTVIERTSELKKSHDNMKLKAEELKKVSHYKTQFLANMSHEIRTPMNGIYGSLQILNESNQHNESSAIIDTALVSCRGLLTIVNDILDFSKIEAGKLDIETRHFDATSVVKIVENELKQAADNQAISLITNVDDHFHAFWLGDEVRVKQILLNIVSNAIKFTHKGSVTINVRSSKDALFFDVVDTGIGMSEKLVNNIFERFEQADATTTRAYGGTGLGTSISQNLAKMMGGNITVLSQEGVGSTFKITLPLKQSNPMKNEGTDIENQRLIPDLTGVKVLLAEDNKINQIIFKKLMAPTNAAIDVAKNGQECIELYERTQPDVIFMDIQMPVMDGIEACKRIKALSQVPIIALTANVMKEDTNHYYEVGFNEVLSKPIELDELYKSCVECQKMNN